MNNDYFENQEVNVPAPFEYDGGYDPYAPVECGEYYPYGYFEAPMESRTKKHIFIKIMAACLAVLLISAGSIGGFAGLVNSGVVTLNVPGGTDTTPAFTINNSKTGATNISTVSALTPEQVAEKVIPSVVCIESYQRNSLQSAGEGSGIIMTSDGYIITNAHVVEGANSLKAVLYDGATYEAKLIGSDSLTDLALIKIEAANLTAADFGNSDNLSVAEAVMAIGNPGGLKFNSSVTTGIVSAVNRQVSNMSCIQTDAAINPGNSGGALVNMAGEVVGINSSKIVAAGFEGLGFAISINQAQPIISDLKNYGYVKDRAALGITYQMIDSMTARIYRVPAGLYVESVTSQKARDAGLAQGDIITEIDSEAVTDAEQLTSVITKLKPGESINITVYHQSTEKEESITVELIEANVTNVTNENA